MVVIAQPSQRSVVAHASEFPGISPSTSLQAVVSRAAVVAVGVDRSDCGARAITRARKLPSRRMAQRSPSEIVYSAEGVRAARGNAGRQRDLVNAGTIESPTPTSDLNW